MCDKPFESKLRRNSHMATCADGFLDEVDAGVRAEAEETATKPPLAVSQEPTTPEAPAKPSMPTTPESALPFLERVVLETVRQLRNNKEPYKTCKCGWSDCTHPWVVDKQSKKCGCHKVAVKTCSHAWETSTSLAAPSFNITANIATSLPEAVRVMRIEKSAHPHTGAIREVKITPLRLAQDSLVKKGLLEVTPARGGGVLYWLKGEAPRAINDVVQTALQRLIADAKASGEIK